MGSLPPPGPGGRARIGGGVGCGVRWVIVSKREAEDWTRAGIGSWVVAWEVLRERPAQHRRGYEWWPPSEHLPRWPIEREVGGQDNNSTMFMNSDLPPQDGTTHDQTNPNTPGNWLENELMCHPKHPLACSSGGVGEGGHPRPPSQLNPSGRGEPVAAASRVETSTTVFWFRE